MTPLSELIRVMRKKSPVVAGGFRKSTECIRWNDKPLGNRQNQAKHRGNEEDQGFLRGKQHPL